MTPQKWTPLNIRALFENEFGACGCSDLPSMLKVVLQLLVWADTKEKRISYCKLFKDKRDAGIFYLMAGQLDRLGLIEHGMSIRHPWLTLQGKALLIAMKQTTFQEIDDASGEGYDGIHHGIVP